MLVSAMISLVSPRDSMAETPGKMGMPAVSPRTGSGILHPQLPMMLASKAFNS